MTIEQQKPGYSHGHIKLYALCLILTLFLLSRPIYADEAQAPPYAVGSQTLFIHDESRGFDPVAGIAEGVRVLITEIWYPADRASITPATPAPAWGDYVFRDMDVHRRMIGETTFFHLTPDSVRAGITGEQIEAAVVELFERPRKSYRGLPPAKNDQPFPIVVMSHGDAGSRYNMVTACQWLAAHGFVVIAADHTGNSPFAMVGSDPALQRDATFRKRMEPILPLLDKHGVYGHNLPYGQSYAPDLIGEPDAADFMQLDRALADRVNDLRAVLQELARMNNQGHFAGKLDLDNIGVMGRSFGGATTMIALRQEPRFKAGFAVVPPALPSLRGLLPPEALGSVPADSPLFGEQGSAFFGHQKPLILLAGAQDGLIIGLEAATAQLADTPGPTADNRQPMLRSVFESTGAFAGFGMLDRTNHGSLGVSGPYWWPDLKPNQFPDPLLPEKTYTLLPAAKAHQLQADMILNFFRAELQQSNSSEIWLKKSLSEQAGLKWNLSGPNE